MRLARRPSAPRSSGQMVAMLVAGGLALSACAGSDEPEGLPLSGEPGQVDGPVFVVKVDNTSSATPQLGLDHADLVVEETVEGGLTRLAAMFEGDQDGVTVGPVRSVRDSDVGVVAPTEGVLAASGGAPGPLDALESAGIRTAIEGDPGFSRATDRPPLYNLMLDLGTLQDSYDVEDAPPDYLDWAQDADSTGDDDSDGESVQQVDLVFSSSHTTTMRRDGDQWRRTGSSADGGGFAADNVLALRVRLQDAGYVDPGGNPVPVTVTTGTGDAVLISGGTAQTLTWSKGSDDDPWQLAGSDGESVQVPAGKTWIGLVPVGGDVVTK